MEIAFFYIISKQLQVVQVVLVLLFINHDKILNNATIIVTYKIEIIYTNLYSLQIDTLSKSILSPPK